MARPNKCPVHGIPDCSPLLNGCAILSAWTEPPDGLLSVVEDWRGVRYFRWAPHSHTHNPWRMIGAIHVDTQDVEDDWSWDDLVRERGRLRPVSEGIDSPIGEPR